MNARYEVTEEEHLMAPPYKYQVVDTGQPDVGGESFAICVCELRDDAERIALALNRLEETEF